ncbi:hypothetical protein IAR50_006600 [Cryptococcus sp. DSM 104548]
MPFTEVTLNDGRSIPAIGFGTWKVPNNATAGQVQQALELGFTHIDTAEIYGNEAEVGQAIKASGLARKDIYVTTKWFAIDGRSPRESALESLKDLGLDVIDLYLIHRPFLVKEGESERIWKEFEGLQRDGLVKSIGVSNYTKPQLEELLSHATIPPAVNQILLHPYVISTQGPLLSYLAEKKIVPEGYSSLKPITSKHGGPVDEPLKIIAERLGKKPEQVLLAWSKAKGAIIVTSSSKKDRLESYLEVGDISLTPEDVKAIDEAGIKGAIEVD